MISIFEGMDMPERMDTDASWEGERDNSSATLELKRELKELKEAIRKIAKGN